MIICDLKANPYLKMCRKALGDPRFDEIADYAQYAVNALLTKQIKAYKSLRLNFFEGIFFRGKSICEITRKKYSSCTPEQIEQLMYCEFLDKLYRGKALFIYPLDPSRGYMMLSPEKIVADLESEVNTADLFGKKQKLPIREKFFDKYLYRLTLKKQGELDMKVGGSIMKDNLKNQAFVTRFNKETYFRGVDLTQLAEERLGISDKESILSFVILYSVAFFGLNFNDIYTVEEIFSFTDYGIRTKDNVKTSSAHALRNDLQRCSDWQLGSMLEQMGQVLFDIQLPELSAHSATDSACRYLLYCAAEQTGKTFLRIMNIGREPARHYRENFRTSYDRTRERAELLSEYRKAAALCDDIGSLMAVKGAVVTHSPRCAQVDELEIKVRTAEYAEL